MDDNFDHDAYTAIRSGIARPSVLSKPSTLSSPSAMGVGLDLSSVGGLDVDAIKKSDSASTTKLPPTGVIPDGRTAATSTNTAYQTRTQGYEVHANIQQGKQDLGTGAGAQRAREEVTKTAVSEPVVGTRGGTSAPAPVISIDPTWGGPAPYPPQAQPPPVPDFTLVEARTLADPRKVELLLQTSSGCYSFIYRIPESTPLPEDVLASLNDQTAETMVRSLFSGDSTPFKVSELLGLLTESGRARAVSGCELPQLAEQLAELPARSMSLLPLLAIAGIGLLVMRYAE